VPGLPDIFDRGSGPVGSRASGDRIATELSDLDTPASASAVGQQHGIDGVSGSRFAAVEVDESGYDDNDDLEGENTSLVGVALRGGLRLQL
jgi:hypothetical protein